MRCTGRGWAVGVVVSLAMAAGAWAQAPAPGVIPGEPGTPRPAKIEPVPPAALTAEEGAAVDRLPDAADRAAARAQAVCPISGEHLGSMGMPIKKVVDGRAVFLCCRGCEADLDRDPKAALAKLAGPTQRPEPAAAPGRATPGIPGIPAGPETRGTNLDGTPIVAPPVVPGVPVPGTVIGTPNVPGTPVVVPAPSYAPVSPVYDPAMTVAPAGPLVAIPVPTYEGSVKPGGEKPGVAVVEGIDEDGNLALRKSMLSYATEVETRQVPVTQQVERDGQVVPETRMQSQQVPVTRVRPFSYRFKKPLAEVEVYDLAGRRITDESYLRRIFARPGVVLHAVNRPGIKGIDPAYLAVGRPGTVLVVTPADRKAAPLVAGGLNRLPRVEGPLGAGGAMPEIGVTRGLDEAGNLVFDPLYPNAPPPPPVPLKQVMAFNQRGQRLDEAAVRRVLSQPAVVLTQQAGMPVDPGYLAVARDGVPLVFMPPSAPAKLAPAAMSAPVPAGPQAPSRPPTVEPAPAPTEPTTPAPVEPAPAEPPAEPPAATEAAPAPTEPNPPAPGDVTPAAPAPAEPAPANP